MRAEVERVSRLVRQEQAEPIGSASLSTPSDQGPDGRGGEGGRGGGRAEAEGRHGRGEAAGQLENAPIYIIPKDCRLDLPQSEKARCLVFFSTSF